MKNQKIPDEAYEVKSSERCNPVLPILFGLMSVTLCIIFMLKMIIGWIY